MSEDLLQNIQPILLMGPGPSPVCPAAYAALGKPTLGHLDPYFIKIMDGIKEQLRQVFHTKNDMTLTILSLFRSLLSFISFVNHGHCWCCNFFSRSILYLTL